MKKRIGNRIIWIAVAAMIGLSACSEKNAADVPALMQSVGVVEDTEVVKRGYIGVIDEYSAAVKARMTNVSFDPDVGGMSVTWFECTVGTPVQAGDALIRLDTTQLERDIEALQEQIDNQQKRASDLEAIAAAELKISELQIKLARDAGTEGDEITLMQIARDRQKLVQSQARETRQIERERLNARMADLQDLLDKSVLRAPCDGVVAVINVQFGARVSSNNVAVMIADMDDLFVEVYNNAKIYNSEKYRYAVAIGTHELPLQYTVTDTRRELSYAATGGNAPQRFEFAGVLPADVVAGRFAQVYRITAEAENALLVPGNAVQTSPEGKYVYRAMNDENGEQIKETVYIKIGITNESYVEVLEGLQEGDVILVK